MDDEGNTGLRNRKKPVETVSPNPKQEPEDMVVDSEGSDEESDDGMDPLEAIEDFVAKYSKAYKEGTSWVTLLAGPMFSGKTTMLLQLGHELLNQGFDVWLYTHVNEKARLGPDKPPASKVGKDSKQIIWKGDYTYVGSISEMERDVWERLDGKKESKKQKLVILVDEIQFFKFDYVSLKRMITDSGFSFVFSGLHEDYRGDRWDTTTGVANCFANESYTMTADCDDCGEPALHTSRMDLSVTDTVKIGSTESYKASCKAHWNRPHEGVFTKFQRRNKLCLRVFIPPIAVFMILGMLYASWTTADSWS